MEHYHFSLFINLVWSDAVFLVVNALLWSFFHSDCKAQCSEWFTNLTAFCWVGNLYSVDCRVVLSPCSSPAWTDWWESRFSWIFCLLTGSIVFWDLIIAFRFSSLLTLLYYNKSDSSPVPLTVVTHEWWAWIKSNYAESQNCFFFWSSVVTPLSCFISSDNFIFFLLMDAPCFVWTEVESVI